MKLLTEKKYKHLWTWLAIMLRRPIFEYNDIKDILIKKDFYFFLILNMKLL